MLPARHDAYRPDLRHRLYDEDARHDRIIGEVPLEERLVLGDVLYPDGPDPGSSSTILSTSKNG